MWVVNNIRDSSGDLKIHIINLSDLLAGKQVNVKLLLGSLTEMSYLTSYQLMGCIRTGGKNRKQREGKKSPIQGGFPFRVR